MPGTKPPPRPADPRPDRVRQWWLLLLLIALLAYGYVYLGPPGRSRSREAFPPLLSDVHRTMTEQGAPLHRAMRAANRDLSAEERSAAITRLHSELKRFLSIVDAQIDRLRRFDPPPRYEGYTRDYRKVLEAASEAYGLMIRGMEEGDPELIRKAFEANDRGAARLKELNARRRRLLGGAK